MDGWIVDEKSKQTAEDMLLALAGMCNHASSWDGAGFSKMDAEFGHSLARHASAGKPWTIKQASAAVKLIQKYQRQLGGKDHISKWIQNPIFKRAPIGPESAAADSQNSRKLISRDSTAVFVFQYDASLVQSIKTEIKGVHRDKKFWASWDPSEKCWTVPVNETSIRPIMDVAQRFGFQIEDRFVEYLEKVAEKTAESRTMLALNDNRHVVVAGDTIMVSVDDAAILEEFEKLLKEGV